MAEYFSGDTIRMRATFKDELDALTDPDSDEIFVSVFNAANLIALVDEDLATKDAVGTYYYDYTFPEETVTVSYIVEFKGIFSGEPQLKRFKTKAKFVVT